MGDDRLPNIDKLDGSNWPIWKMQMMNYFQVRDLWDLCGGIETVPVQAEGETQVAFATREKTYQRNIAHVLSILGQMVLTSFTYRGKMFLSGA